MTEELKIILEMVNQTTEMGLAGFVLYLIATLISKAFIPGTLLILGTLLFNTVRRSHQLDHDLKIRGNKS